MEGFFDTILICGALMAAGWIMRMMYELKRDAEDERWER